MAQPKQRDQKKKKKVYFLQNFSEALTLSCASGIAMRKVANATLPKPI